MDEFRMGARIASAQHGLLARPQLLGCGLSPAIIQRWLDAGRLQAPHPGVYRVAGAPATWQQSVAAACRRRLLAKVDFAYPDLRIAIEVDGHETHSTPRALQSDLDRQNRLVAAGWTVLRFTWADVVRRPEKVSGRIRHVLGSLDTAGRCQGFTEAVGGAGKVADRGTEVGRWGCR